MTLTPKTGDLLVNASSSAILSTVDETNLVTVTAGAARTLDVTGDVNFERVILAGTDLAERISGIADQPGVGDSNVDTDHIADSTLTTEKFSLLSADKGGTGLSKADPHELLFSTASGIATSTSLTAARHGIVLGSGWSLEVIDGATSARFSESNGSLMLTHSRGGTLNVANLSVSAGSPPTIESLTLEGPRLDYKLRDVDGDLRSLHLAWYTALQSPAPSREDVFYYATGEGSSSFTAPAGSAEVDLFKAINTGSASFEGQCGIDISNISDISKLNVYAVAEDGPGNLSAVKSADHIL